MNELKEGISIIGLAGVRVPEIATFLNQNGFELYSNRSSHNLQCIRTMKRMNKLYYIINDSSKIEGYIRKGVVPYRDDITYTYEEFTEKFMSKDIPEVKLSTQNHVGEYVNFDNIKNPVKVGCVSQPKYPPTPTFDDLIEPPLQISKSKVLEAYKATTSIDVRQLLKILFGKELFDEKYYKIGNKFKYSGISGNKEYKLIKVNLSVVTIIDEDGENFCSSKTVKDPYKITESELRNLLGIYFDKFTLI